MRDVTPAYDESRLRTLGILPHNDQPPFDIIGDVHGCIDELCALLEKLGYRPSGDGYTHDAGRRLVFVGDLVDRGPGSVPVLKMALAMHSAGSALFVMGNHDVRFLRWLYGKNVRIAYGLSQTIAELDTLSAPVREAMCRRVRRLFEETPGYLILDEGRLVVTHGGIRDSMIGSWNGETATYCLYGEVEGYSATGKPLRRDWAAHRHVPSVPSVPPMLSLPTRQIQEREVVEDSVPSIVYGHNVVNDLRWVNRTLDLDTGCVYGGTLSALRYPELELVQVAARKTYAHRV